MCEAASNAWRLSPTRSTVGRSPSNSDCPSPLRSYATTGASRLMSENTGRHVSTVPDAPASRMITGCVGFRDSRPLVSMRIGRPLTLVINDFPGASWPLSDAAKFTIDAIATISTRRPFVISSHLSSWPLLVAQGDKRVDIRGPSCGHQCRTYGNCGEHERHGNERRWIERGQAEQHSCEVS